MVEKARSWPRAIVFRMACKRSSWVGVGERPAIGGDELIGGIVVAGEWAPAIVHRQEIIGGIVGIAGPAEEMANCFRGERARRYAPPPYKPSLYPA
jgi:hypothetical protein